MAQTAEAVLVNDGMAVKFVAATTYAGGEIIRLPDGRGAVVAGLAGFVSGDTVTAYPLGRFSVLSASATLFSIGDPVYFDISASLAIVEPGAVGDILLGTATKAKIDGELIVDVDFNVGFAGAGASGQRGVWASRASNIAHDDTTDHDLILAAENPNGLMVVAFVGLVTETIVGGSEDQLVIELFDEDNTSLSTMTTTDTTPDVAGDAVLGVGTIANGATGEVLAIIPAGKGAYAKVTQPTAGSPAGEVTVSVLVVPLI